MIVKYGTVRSRDVSSERSAQPTRVRPLRGRRYSPERSEPRRVRVGHRRWCAIHPCLGAGRCGRALGQLRPQSSLDVPWPGGADQGSRSPFRDRVDRDCPVGPAGLGRSRQCGPSSTGLGAGHRDPRWCSSELHRPASLDVQSGTVILGRARTGPPTRGRSPRIACGQRRLRAGPRRRHRLRPLTQIFLDTAFQMALTDPAASNQPRGGHGFSRCPAVEPD